MHLVVPNESCVPEVSVSDQGKGDEGQRSGSPADNSGPAVWRLPDASHARTGFSPMAFTTGSGSMQAASPASEDGRDSRKRAFLLSPID
jgi:hypothetical protein